jgi:uncharacterized membrane protein
MISKANLAGHPIHPILVTIPVGLWIFSLACDIIYRATGNTMWDTVALYSLAGGVIGALLAALPGFFDLYFLPASQAKRIGLWHMTINLCLVTAYVINYFWRLNVEPAAIGPMILSILTVISLLVSGWLGGELVFRHGVAVLPVDHLKAHDPLEKEENIFGLHLHHRH